MIFNFDYLTCAVHCDKHMVSFNPHNNQKRLAVLLTPFYRKMGFNEILKLAKDNKAVANFEYNPAFCNFSVLHHCVI